MVTTCALPWIKFRYSQRGVHEIYKSNSTVQNESTYLRLRDTYGRQLKWPRNVKFSRMRTRGLLKFALGQNGSSQALSLLQRTTSLAIFLSLNGRTILASGSL